VLVKPEQAEDLAVALVSLLRDPQRRRAMSANGRKKAQQYAWPLVAARVLDFYTSVRERIFAASPSRARHAAIQRVERPA